MNNSKIAIDSISLTDEEELDTTPALRQRETELAQIIEALEHINGSNYWKLLQDKIFQGILDSLQSRLAREKEPIEMYRLQGQIKWAEKYPDLLKLADGYRNELINIRKKLHA